MAPCPPCPYQLADEVVGLPAHHSRRRHPAPRPCRRHAVAAALLLVIVALRLGASSPNALVKDARSSWEAAVHKAAEAAVKAVQQQSGVDLALRDVPLETLQVFNGRQHAIGLSMDGVEYQVVLGSDQELSQRLDQQQQLPQAQQEHALVASGLVRQHWQAQAARALDATPAAQQVPSLPDVSLSGPLELHVQGDGPVRLFTPHAVDIGGGQVVRSVKLAAGVTVKLLGLRTIELRRPLDLPSLPMGYLAEVYAHAKLGQAGSSVEASPGVHYLANALRSLALNTSLPLLSFDVTAADPQAGLAFEAVSDMQLHVGVPPRKLKVKRDRHGHVELQLRQGEVLATGRPADHLDVVTRVAQLARPWAWPLPHVDLWSLVPYEALLRSILAAHPFDLLKVKNHGISMRVTRSEITGTRLMAFEMEVRSRATSGASHQGVPEEFAEAYAQLGVNPEEDQLMVFDVLVSVREKGGADPALTYVPLSVKLRQVHGTTLSMSRVDAQAMLTGQANATDVVTPGYDHQDYGVASREAGQ